RQSLNNIVYVACSALKLLGGVTVAIVTTGDAISFFAWQLFASFASAGIYAAAFWVSVPHGQGRARFDSQSLAGVWRFAVGMSGITVGLLLFNQADKIAVSRTVLLEQFGYYALAGTIVGS